MINQKRAQEYLEHGAPFVAHNLRGECYFVTKFSNELDVWQGRMPDDEYTELRALFEKIRTTYRETGEHLGHLYVIYSYATPIAWRHYDYDGNGVETRYTDARHSVTTARHVGIVRRAWGA